MAGRASSSFTYGWTYDVFLSFRGEDTRTGFIGHLYKALNQRGIRTFVDDEKIQKGEEITPALLKAIEESRIAIPVLSENYAASSLCLDELVKILECIKEKGRLVFPVYYCVDPSHVRHQRGSYEIAFAKHEKRFKDNKEKVQKWRMALRQVAHLSGYHFRHGDEYEYAFIERIINEVSSKINYAPLHVADYPVGLESRVLKVNWLLDGAHEGVHMVGIYGIGGIGKTTIARAVYNSIANQFEGLCFLDNVRENSIKYGLVHLQEMLLSEIVGDKDINIGSVNKGISVIKHRLHRKRVLLVLDDVDRIEQLRAIVGAPDWFGHGSKVVITTRDKRLLVTHGVERTYEVEELSEQEALELLIWNAFKTDKVDPSYVDILNRAVTYASRLPLALEVIGSNLFGKRIEEWQNALDKYERIPDQTIQKILKISFDSLEEVEQKLFLDIACCFRGYKLADLEDILCAHHDLPMKYSIEVLIEKSLIKIDYFGHVTLHDLIQDMGREIVRQESPNEPGRRSRLWFPEDVIQVLEENTGTNEIEILILDFPKDEVHSNGSIGEEVDWDGEAFKKMAKLKTLIIRNGCFSMGPIHLPNSLRVLKWCGYPSTSLPYDFHPKKLAILELPESCLTPCEPIQMFVFLSVLDFGYSEWITQIPDVSGVPNLKKLSFRHCENLIEIHPSVGYLDKLRILDAVRCRKLKTFPPIKLTSLEQLNLSHCSVLESFPEILGKMENITELHIMGSPVKELPFSIRNLTRLRKLELQFCEMVQLPSSIFMLPELSLMQVSRCEGLWLSKQEEGEEMVCSNMECLILSYCNLSDEFLPIGLAWFANVKDLNLSGNNFTILHACIKECHFLSNLKLDDCRLLREIRGIPWKLETFSAKGCTSLKMLDLTVLPACTEECHFLRELILDDCVYLREIIGVPPNLDNFSAKNCTSLTSWCKSMLLNQELHEAGNKIFSLPGTRIPEWFDHRTRGGSISFWFHNKFPAISLCLVIGLVNEQPIRVKFSPQVIINGNKQSLAYQKVYEFGVATDHIFLFDLQLLKFEDNVDMVFSENEWNRVEVSYADHITNDEVPIKLVAKQSGIHVFKQLNSIEDIRFTNPYYKKRKSSVFLSNPVSENQLLLKEKHRLVDMGVSETQFLQKQQHLLTPHVEHGRERFPLLPAQDMQNVNWGRISMEGPRQRVKTTALRPLNAQTIVFDGSEETELTSQPATLVVPPTNVIPPLVEDQPAQLNTPQESTSPKPSLPILTSTQPLPAETEKGQVSRQTPSFERHCKDIGCQTSEKLPEDEVQPTTIQNDAPVKEEDCRGDDVELELVSFGQLESEESSYNAEGSDSDNPFDWVNTKLSVSRKQTTSFGASSGDASLTSIREAFEAFELLMVKELSEASADPATQSELDHLLDLLSTSSHPKVTVEVKQALLEFKRKALASFEEFQATVEPVNKLKNFEKQRAKILQETVAGNDRRKNIKNSIKKASLVIKDENKRKKELEAEIVTLRKQLAAKESDLERLVLNVKSQEATLSTYLTTYTSLEKHARTLLKEADDLVAANTGVEDEGEASEVKQNRLKSTWSTDLTSQFIKIKKKILGDYD